RVGIDSLAGPSEVVIIADRSTSVEDTALDLQAQAEHDPQSPSVLLSTDRALLKKVRGRLSKNLVSHVTLKFTSSVQEAIAEANRLAPEHLELLVQNAERYLPLIRHAGAFFQRLIGRHFFQTLERYKLPSPRA